MSLVSQLLTLKKFRCIKQFYVTRFSISTLLFVSVTVATIFESFPRLLQFPFPPICFVSKFLSVCVSMPLTRSNEMYIQVSREQRWRTNKAK